MLKFLHICGICKEETQKKSFKICCCEYCHSRLHAKCVFPYESEAKLKVLNEFNLCYTVKCTDCKLKRKPKTYIFMVYHIY